LPYVFLFHYHGLWCPVYCYEWFCRFAFVDYILWLPYLHDLFRLIYYYYHHHRRRHHQTLEEAFIAIFSKLCLLVIR
jgi:hypothetical protein